MKKISGVGKRHILKNFFKRINTPYDLRILNAIDGEEMLHLALTKKSIYAILSSFLVLSFILVSFLFLFTPMKYYIPGYETNASRKKLVALHAQIDELQQKQSNYDKMIKNVGGVITDDDRLFADTVGLSKDQLNSAEMNNESNIGTSLGKRRVIGKKRLDTTNRPHTRGQIGSGVEETKSLKPSQEPLKKAVKKRDTIITYQ